MSGLVRLELDGDYPTLISFDENGSLESACWQNEMGEPHRDNGFPSRVEYKRQRVIGQSYWMHGEPCRDNDLPYDIYYYQSGEVCWEFWGNNYTHDRVTGPISIYYDENGNITKESYAIKKEHVSKEKWLQDSRVKRIIKNNASGLIVSEVSL